MKPRALKSGDLVELVSPASPITEAQVAPITKLFNDAGYRVRLAKNALASDGFLAGSDEDRAADLHSAFDDPEVSAVVCTRGGYGCARLLPFLDIERMARSEKLFAGFSDITTLHLALNQAGMPTLHAPMALTLFYDREDWVYDSFIRALKGDLSVASRVPKGTMLYPGTVRGNATGGCMCLLSDSIGTAFPFDPAGKIVFIEDVDEAPHRVDAMLTHFLNCGLLQEAAGIVFGEMTRTDQNVDTAIGSRNWRDIVRERTKILNIPVIIDFPFGHAKNMLTLGLGIEVEMNADLGTVRYLESVCV